MKRSSYFLILALILGLGFAIRLYVAHTSPVLHDEDDYLSSARAYREADGIGDLPNVVHTAEHPPLVKLVFAAVLDPHELDAIPATVERSSRNPLPPHSLHRTRLVSVFAGVLTLAITALTNPLAAVLLAGESIHVQFSAAAYLDSIPTLFTALAIYAYTRTFTAINRQRWFLLGVSAVSLGVGVTAKYPFALVGIVIALHALVYRKWRFSELLVWGVAAIVVFFLFNPYLWKSPLDRLWDQATYHKTYADNQVPTYSPLKPIEQLLTPNEHFPDELQSPLWVIVDGLIFVFMLPGVVILLRQKSVYGWWMILGLLFLMVYPSQWIQHKMMIVVPYSIAAASGLQWLWGLLWRQADKLTYPPR